MESNNPSLHQTQGGSTYTFDAAAQLSNISYGTGNISRGFTYNGRGHLATDTVKNGATTLQSLAYEWDANGNLTKKTIGPASVAGAGTNQYGYDRASRLTSWTAPNAAVTNYTWDDNNNRLTAGPTSFTYDARNRMTTSAAPGKNTTYAWTARGTLKSTTLNGTPATTQFDAFGRTVTETQNSVAKNYTYDGLDRVRTSGATTLGWSGLSQNLADDGASGKYSHDLGGQPAGVRTGATNQLAISDQHGDLVGTAAKNGTAMATTKAFDPWGTVTATVGAGQPSRGYQGDWTDPTTGRVDMNARFYTPGTGTFSSSDTFDDPAMRNSYGYTAANPLSQSDPSGHCTYEYFLIPRCGADNLVARAMAMVLAAQKPKYVPKPPPVNHPIDWMLSKVNNRPLPAPDLVGTCYCMAPSAPSKGNQPAAARGGSSRSSGGRSTTPNHSATPTINAPAVYHFPAPTPAGTVNSATVVGTGGSSWSAVGKSGDAPPQAVRAASEASSPSSGTGQSPTGSTAVSGSSNASTPVSLDVCKSRGGVNYSETGVCYEPPTNKADGSTCQPPITADGKPIIYSASRNNCEVGYTEISCAHGPDFLNPICQHQEGIIQALEVVVVVALVVATVGTLAPAASTFLASSPFTGMGTLQAGVHGAATAGATGTATGGGAAGLTRKLSNDVSATRAPGARWGGRMQGDRGAIDFSNGKTRGEAEAARDAAGLKPNGTPNRNSAVYIGVAKDGKVAGVGSQPGGLHAEDVAQAQMPGGQMTQPMGWRRNPATGQLEWTPIKVCFKCQGNHPPSLFAPGVTAVEEGPWGR